MLKDLLQFQIVPEASASYDGFNVARDAIKANHMDMARFVKRDDGYNRVLGHIQDILDTKLPKPEQVDIKVVEARYDRKFCHRGLYLIKACI